jgi:hypothetical protein
MAAATYRRPMAAVALIVAMMVAIGASWDRIVCRFLRHCP